MGPFETGYVCFRSKSDNGLFVILRFVTAKAMSFRDFGGRRNDNNNDNRSNGPSGGQRRVEKCDSCIAGFVVQG